MAFVRKYLRTPPPIDVAGRHIKRYHVRIGDGIIDEPIEQAAYALLPELLPEADGELPPASFIVLHQTSAGAFLNVYSWVWGNVLEFAGAAAGAPILGCPDEDPTHFVRGDKPWIGCVWELPALGHEPGAWVRHVFGPDKPDLDGYLADQLPEGPTGG
jgi:hypothetical protein